MAAEQKTLYAPIDLGECRSIEELISLIVTRQNAFASQLLTLSEAHVGLGTLTELIHEKVKQTTWHSSRLCVRRRSFGR
jgi:hypothetical protein